MLSGMARRGMSKTAKYVVGGGVALGVVGLIWYLAKPKTTADKQSGGGDTTGTNTVAATGGTHALAPGAPPNANNPNAVHPKTGVIKPPPPLDPNTGNWA